MDQKNFYYRQKVLEGDLNDSFDAGTRSERYLAIAADIINRETAPGEFGGIVKDFTIDTDGLNVSFTELVAYDGNGRRITIPPTTIVLSNAGYTAIGALGSPLTANGASLDPGEGTLGRELWASIFIKYEDLMSDLRYDGYNQSLYYQNDESFRFYVKAGDVCDLGDLPAIPDPALETGMLLVCDVHLKHETSPGVFTIDHVHGRGDGELPEVRTSWYFTYNGTSSNHRFNATPRDALKSIASLVDAHITGIDPDYKHATNKITHSPNEVWADADGKNYGASTNVFEALEGIVNDLNTKVAADGITESGATCIGIKATELSSLISTSSDRPFELPNATLQAALEDIKDAINGCVYRGGDELITGNLAPATTATYSLGTNGLRWRAFLETVTASAFDSNLKPNVASTYDIGNATDKWKELHAESGTFHTALNVNNGAASATAIKGTATNASNTGIAISGENLSSDSSAQAITGQADAGTGVKGISVTNNGVEGYSTEGNGVYGAIDATLSLPSSCAIKGINPQNSGATDGVAVFGKCTGSNNNGTAIHGENLSANTDALGVVGSTYAGTGVTGYSRDKRGVYGECTGAANIGSAVHGYNNSTEPFAKAIKGEANAGIGVLGTSVTGVGVKGSSFSHYSSQTCILEVPLVPFRSTNQPVLAVSEWYLYDTSFPDYDESQVYIRSRLDGSETTVAFQIWFKDFPNGAILDTVQVDSNPDSSNLILYAYNLQSYYDGADWTRTLATVFTASNKVINTAARSYQQFYADGPVAARTFYKYYNAGAGNVKHNTLILRFKATASYQNIYAIRTSWTFRSVSSYASPLE